MSPRRVAAAAFPSLAFVGCPPPSEGQRVRAWAEPAGGDAPLRAPRFRLESELNAGCCAHIDANGVVDVEAGLLARTWEVRDDGRAGGNSSRKSPCLTPFTYGVAPEDDLTSNRIAYTDGDERKTPARLRNGRRYSIRLHRRRRGRSVVSTAAGVMPFTCKGRATPTAARPRRSFASAPRGPRRARTDAPAARAAGCGGAARQKPMSNEGPTVTALKSVPVIVW